LIIIAAGRLLPDGGLRDPGDASNGDDDDVPRALEDEAGLRGRAAPHVVGLIPLRRTPGRQVRLSCAAPGDERATGGGERAFDPTAGRR
jgi:hypothetical protein